MFQFFFHFWIRKKENNKYLLLPLQADIWKLPSMKNNYCWVVTKLHQRYSCVSDVPLFVFFSMFSIIEIILNQWWFYLVQLYERGALLTLNNLSREMFCNKSVTYCIISPSLTRLVFTLLINHSTCLIYITNSGMRLISWSQKCHQDLNVR